MQPPSDQWDYFYRKVVSLRRNLEDLTKLLDKLEKENSERSFAQRLYDSMNNMRNRKPPFVPTRKRPVSRQVLMKLHDIEVGKEDGGLDVGPSAPRKRQRMNYENSSSTSIVSTYGQLVGNERQLAVYKEELFSRLHRSNVRNQMYPNTSKWGLLE